MSDLAKCRMCGGTPENVFLGDCVSGKHYVKCSLYNCGHTTDGFEFPHEAEAAWNADAAKVSFPLEELTVGEWSEMRNGETYLRLKEHDHIESVRTIVAKTQMSGRAPHLVCATVWPIHSHLKTQEPITSFKDHPAQFADTSLAQQWCMDQLLSMCVEQRKKLEATRWSGLKTCTGTTTT